MHVVDRAVYERLCKHVAQLYGEEELPRILSRIELLVGRYGVGGCKDEHCGDSLWDQRDALLVAYGDMLSDEGEPPLRSLLRFLDNRLGDAVSAVHLLPFFPSSSEDGFAVVDYRQVEPALGDWDDVRALGARYRLMVDLVVNHVSSKSQWFRNFSDGIAPERHYFVTVAPGTDLGAVSHPRTTPLLRPVQTPSGERLVWATFGPDRIDLDFRNPDVLFEFLDILVFYVHHGARVLRLCDIAYLWKEIGTSCLHLEQSHQVVKVLRDLLELLTPGILLVAETDIPHRENIRYFGAGDEAHMLYQGDLPPLLLHALETGDGRYLGEWAANLEAPPPGCTYCNFTASYGAVGLMPLRGLLPDGQIAWLAGRMQEKGGAVRRRPRPDGSDYPYEVAIRYFDALGCAPGPSDPRADDLGLARFLCSQAIMLSLRGIPAIYLTSLFGVPERRPPGELAGEAPPPPTVDRRKWRLPELDALLDDPAGAGARILARYLQLLKIRRAHPAFHPDGAQRALELPPGLFGIERLAPDGSERIRMLANLSAAPLTVAPGMIARPEDHRFCELIEGWTCPGAELGPLELAPYQVMWLEG